MWKSVQFHFSVSTQGQLLKGAECHIYLYCFTFVYIDLNRAFVIIVLFPTKYSSKKVYANCIGKWNALGIYWYIFYSFILIISATFFQVKILHVNGINSSSYSVLPKTALKID